MLKIDWFEQDHLTQHILTKKYLVHVEIAVLRRKKTTKQNKNLPGENKNVTHTNTFHKYLCFVFVMSTKECLFNFVETERKMYFLECVEGGAKQTNCNKEFTFATLYVLLNATQTTKIYLWENTNQHTLF